MLKIHHKKSDSERLGTAFNYLIIKPLDYSHSIVADGFGDIS